MTKRVLSIGLTFLLALAALGGLALAAKPTGGGGGATKLKPPSGLTATAGDALVTLRWTSAGTRGVGGYRVYRRSADGTWPATALATVPASATSYADGGLTNGTTYA